MRKIIVIVLAFLMTSFCFAKTQKEEYQNDYLYSAEYFDYLIECAQQDREEMLKEQNKEKEIILPLAKEIEISDDDYIPFKIRIEQYANIKPYKDTFKKADTKTIIPISEKFSIVQNTSKTRNKYNSDDYKILAGGEYKPLKFLNIASGIETNFRGLDQNPTSRKLYFSPSISYKDKISLGFYNKLNILNYSSDHDIGVNISPFKSKIVDFDIYSGLTRKKDGTTAESINFSTNFYF